MCARACVCVMCVWCVCVRVCACVCVCVHMRMVHNQYSTAQRSCTVQQSMQHYRLSTAIVYSMQLATDHR